MTIVIPLDLIVGIILILIGIKIRLRGKLQKDVKILIEHYVKGEMTYQDWQVYKELKRKGVRYEITSEKTGETIWIPN